MPYNSRVIVVDDRLEDGESIVKMLRREAIASFFFHYDDLNIENLKSKTRAFSGIRVIFQDIELMGSGSTPGDKDYNAAVRAINLLLHKNNGPWLMVAWSTWGDDPDRGDKYARELFNLMRQRCDEGKKPFSYVVMDKKPYTSDNSHGFVKPDLTDHEVTNLLAGINGAFGACGALRALSQWESDTQRCVSETTHNLWEIVRGAIKSEDPVNLNKGLENLLFKLAYEQDKTVEQSNISKQLYSALSGILLDKTHNLPPPPISVSVDSKKLTPFDPAILNTYFHWDAQEQSNKKPGTVFLYPRDGLGKLPFQFKDDDELKNFIYSYFVVNSKLDAAKKDIDLIKNVKLVLVDVTPFCDYSERNSEFRNIMVALKVNSTKRDHFYSGSKNIYGNGVIFESPVLHDLKEGPFTLLLNGRLFFTLLVDSKVFEELTVIGRIREQLLNQVSGRVGQQITRIGMLSFS